MKEITNTGSGRPGAGQLLPVLQRRLRDGAIQVLAGVDLAASSARKREWLVADREEEELAEQIENVRLARRMVQQFPEFVLHGKSLRPLQKELRKRVAAREAAAAAWRDTRLDTARRVLKARRCLDVLQRVERRMGEIAAALSELDPETIAAIQGGHGNWESGGVQAEIEKVESLPLFGGLHFEMRELAEKPEAVDDAA